MKDPGLKFEEVFRVAGIMARFVQILSRKCLNALGALPGAQHPEVCDLTLFAPQKDNAKIPRSRLNIADTRIEDIFQILVRLISARGSVPQTCDGCFHNDPP